MIDNNDNQIENEIVAIEKESEYKPIAFWEQKQRELVTSVVDYNLSTLTDLVNNGDINLKPDYQRRDRWSEEKKSQLIESFLMNVPIPPIFLSEDAYGQYSVIDGRQRLTAIADFINNAFSLIGLEVFSDINHKKFRDLPSRLQTVIRTRPILRSVIILRQSDPDIKYEVFRRLNTGGVKLNAQEIRNSVYAGDLNAAIVKLSETKSFQQMIGIINPNTSTLYQEMGDVELVLRFAAFRKTWRSFNGGIVRNLDRFMDENKHMTGDEIENIKKDFLETLEKVKLCFGNYSFRRWRPDVQKWRNQILAAAYDTQMLALREFTMNELNGKLDAIQEEYKKMFLNEEFQKALGASTPEYFIQRVQIFIDAIKKVL